MMAQEGRKITRPPKKCTIRFSEEKRVANLVSEELVLQVGEGRARSFDRLLWSRRSRVLSGCTNLSLRWDLWGALSNRSVFNDGDGGLNSGRKCFDSGRHL